MSRWKCVCAIKWLRIDGNTLNWIWWNNNNSGYFTMPFRGLSVSGSMVKRGKNELLKVTQFWNLLGNVQLFHRGGNSNFSVTNSVLNNSSSELLKLFSWIIYHPVAMIWYIYSFHLSSYITLHFLLIYINM